MKAKTILLFAALISLAVLVAAVALLTVVRRNATRIEIRVRTAYSGASADEVLHLVTEPLENELATVQSAVELRSTSRSGSSAITVELAEDAEPLAALGEVRAAVERAQEILPEDAGTPLIADVSAQHEYAILVRGEPDRAAAARLMSEVRTLPGVTSVDDVGVPSPFVRVEADPSRLAAIGITVAGLATIVRQALHSGDSTMDSVGSVLLDVQAPVRPRVVDVATIRLESRPPRYRATLAGEPAWGVLVRGASGLRLGPAIERWWAGQHEHEPHLFAPTAETLTIDGSTSQANASGLLDRIVRRVGRLPGVAATLSRTEGNDASLVRATVFLVANGDTAGVAQQIRESGQMQPGAKVQVTGDAPLTDVFVMADSYETADRAAAGVAKKLDVVWDDRVDPVSEISVEVDPTRAAELGIAAADVTEALHLAATGEIVGKVRVDDNPVDVLVGVPEEKEPWKRAVVLTRGSLVPIQSVASVFTRLEKPALLRRNQQPCVTLRARGISREHLDAAVAELPAGATVEVGRSRRR